MDDIGGKQYWSMTEGAFNCLIDHNRTEAFRNAIKNTVQSGNIVVDMGTGTGVLAMFAAQCGAKKVYAIEIDPRNVATLRNTFQENSMGNKIEVIEGDVTKVNLPEKIDVVVGEMIATGLIEELQIPAMNNILRYAKSDTKVVLNRYLGYLDLVQNNQKFYDLSFPVVRYEYAGEDDLVSVSLSDRIKYLDIDFSKQNSDGTIVFDSIFTCCNDGIINGVRISCETIFSDRSVFGSSFAYSYPIILPTGPWECKIGDKFQLKLSYKLCGGFSSLNYNVKRI